MIICRTLKNLSTKTVARNTLWMLISNVGRLAIQAIYYVIIARVLGVESFGIFTGAWALVMVLVPFAGWGSGNLLIRYVSMDRSLFSVYWGNAIAVVIVTSSLLSALTLLLGSWAFPSFSLKLVLALTISEFLLGRLAEIAGQAFQALQRLQWTAALNVSVSVVRLVAACAFALLPLEHSVETWGWLYLAASLVAALFGLCLVCMQLGMPHLDVKRIRRDAREGWLFSLGLAAHITYTDMDKTLLAGMASPSEAGLYSAAYRIVGVALAPIRSLLSATYSRFFQAGTSGLHGSLELALRLLPYTVTYGICASLGLHLAAPLLPLLLGSEYQGTEVVVRWLSIIPLLQSIHYIAADTLTGAGYQGIRSAVQLLAATLNVGLNLCLIPKYSWLGSAWSSLASDGALVLILWALVLFRSHRVRVRWQR